MLDITLDGEMMRFFILEQGGIMAAERDGQRN
jgi:hypothetical protein